MENGNKTPEIVNIGIVERLNKSERDSQVAIAKQYPREISTFKKKATEMATFDEATAAECFYSVPRSGTRIEGPSVRLAEIVVSAWGNIRAQARVVDIDETHITAEGVAWDLETNSAISMSVQRRITDKNGKRYSADMITVTGAAACAIAFRNAIFKIVPRVYVRPVYEAARRVAVGDASTLGQRRAQWITAAGKFGVGPDQICAALGRGEIEDLTLDDLSDIAGRLTAIKEGETTAETAFAALATETEDAPKEGRRPFGKKAKA
ncbi:hypothetical protein LCGC14_2028550, partial [marine sediment metagenome]